MNVTEPIWRHAAGQPAAVALRGGGEEWSYERLRDGAAQVAGCLVAEGLTAGDRVLLVAPSVPEFVAAYLGIHAAGAVAVTPNVMSTRPELEYVAVDAGCTVVLAWHEVGSAPAEVAYADGLLFHRLDKGLGGAWRGPSVKTPHERQPEDRR